MSETMNITLEDVDYLVEFEFYPADLYNVYGYDFWEVTRVTHAGNFFRIRDSFWKKLEDKYSKEIHEGILQRVKELKEEYE